MNKKLVIVLCLPARLPLFLLLAGGLLIANCQLVSAQQSGSASLTSVDTSKLDTNYVKLYKDKLIIGLWQSERRFDIHLNQKLDMAMDSTEINYIANSNHVSGISLDYDIIGFAFGYRSLPPDNAKKTGTSDYLDFGLNINTRSVRLENSFKRYTGFYDNNSKFYMDSLALDTTYFKNSRMSIRVVKSKLIYQFSKKKFAMGAAYANVKKQVKSKGSWLLIGNFYALNMFSDSSVIPLPHRVNYGEKWDGLNRMNVYAFSTGVGGTYTFVFWKNFYFNFLVSFGFEAQYRHFYTLPENTHHAYWQTWSAGDWRTSLGYNGKRFFMRVSTIQDINNYESADLKFDMKFIAGSFDFGYRFNIRTPKPYRKFQETRLYKML